MTHHSPLISLYHQLDRLVRRHLGLWLLVVLVIALRLPSLCEPYWYGDEGIYLTVGNGLRQGKHLYAEIVDHKTPLIYYLAMTPSQLWFRILMMAWMIGTTICFYAVTARLKWPSWARHLSTLLFVLLTTWPALEGTIPNGELFVMGFVLAGLVALSRSRLWADLFDLPHSQTASRPEWQYHLTAGALGSLGLLTKVPALFDLAAMGWVGWLVATDWSGSGQGSRLRSKLPFKKWWPVLQAWWWLGLGIALPVIISILYFIARGSGQDYLQFGLLYNFHYAGNWQLNLPAAWLNLAFTLPGKAALMAIILVWLTLWRRWLSPTLTFGLGWLSLTLFAALLSNRPYPHYFLQLAPAVALIITSLLVDKLAWLKDRSRSWLTPLGWLGGLGIMALIPAILLLLHAGLYPTTAYFTRWWKLISGQIDRPTYYQQYSDIMADNTRAADIIRAAKVEEIFIWGTNPVLYALSQTSPVGRFTVSFHIKDLQAYPETLAALEANPPRFIVVMNDESESWPAINQFIMGRGYQPNTHFKYFTLWKLP